MTQLTVVLQCQAHSGYSAFAKEIHGVFTGKPTQARSRNGKMYPIANALEPGATIWEKLNKIVAHYRVLLAQDSNVFFLKEFDHTLKIQEQHIINCLGEVYADQENDYCAPCTPAAQEKKWYCELEDGHFVLNRGTNRNESIHKRLNSMFPEKCGIELQSAILKAFFFKHNFARQNAMVGRVLNGVQPKLVRLSTLGYLQILSQHNPETQVTIYLRGRYVSA